MVSLGKKFGKVMKDLADNAGEQLKETGKYAADGIKDSTLKMSEKIKNKDFPNKEEIRNAFSDTSKKVVEAGKEAAGQAKKAIDNLPHDVKQVDLKETGKKVADQAKKTGEQVAELSKGMADKTRSAVQNLPKDNKGNIDVKASLEKMGNNALDAIEQNLQDQKESKQWTEEVLQEIKNKKKSFNLDEKSCLTLIYCVMNADGNLLPEEEQEYKEICNEFNPSIDSLALLDTIKNENCSISVEDLVNMTLGESKNNLDGTVNPKLLIWDLIAVAWSDHQYSKDERDLISNIREKLNIDETVQMEMEQSYQTIIAVEKEKEQLKQADIEEDSRKKKLSELDKRENVIRTSINTLVMD